MHNLAQAIHWREDVNSGEMIEAPNYKHDYMGYQQISQQELNAICASINLYYEQMNSSLRITNHMGELIPCQIKQ